MDTATSPGGLLRTRVNDQVVKRETDSGQPTDSVERSGDDGVVKTALQKMELQLEELKALMIAQDPKQEAQNQDGQGSYRHNKPRTESGTTSNLAVHEFYVPSYFSNVGPTWDTSSDFSNAPATVGSRAIAMGNDLDLEIPAPTQHNIGSLKQMEGKFVKTGTSYFINEETRKPGLVDIYQHEKAPREEGSISERDTGGLGFIKRESASTALHTAGPPMDEYYIFPNTIVKGEPEELGMEAGNDIKRKNSNMSLMSNYSTVTSQSAEQEAALTALAFDVVKFLTRGISRPPLSLDYLLVESRDGEPSFETMAIALAPFSLDKFFDAVDQCTLGLIGAMAEITRTITDVLSTGNGDIMSARQFKNLDRLLLSFNSTSTLLNILGPEIWNSHYYSLRTNGMVTYDVRGMCAHIVFSLGGTINYLFVAGLALDRLFLAKHSFSQTRTGSGQASQPLRWSGSQVTRELWENFTCSIEHVKRTCGLTQEGFEQCYYNCDGAPKYCAFTLSDSLLSCLLDGQSSFRDLPKDEVMHFISAGSSRGKGALHRSQLALLRGC